MNNVHQVVVRHQGYAQFILLVILCLICQQNIGTHFNEITYICHCPRNARHLSGPISCSCLDKLWWERICPLKCSKLKKLHHNMNKHVNDHLKMWKEEQLWKNGCFKLKGNHCCNNTGSFSESLLSHPRATESA